MFDNSPTVVMKPLAFGVSWPDNRTEDECEPGIFNEWPKDSRTGAVNLLRMYDYKGCVSCFLADNLHEEDDFFLFVQLDAIDALLLIQLELEAWLSCRTSRTAQKSKVKFQGGAAEMAK